MSLLNRRFSREEAETLSVIAGSSTDLARATLHALTTL
jgi:hypothetical protein